MDIGMLWFDNNALDDIKTKIQRAAEYYTRKYGHTPNICFVHPSMLKKDEEKILAGKVEVRSSTNVLPNHFWIGVHATGN